MIPPFDERGYLPPGIHLATLDEIAERFGRSSELRQVQLESLRWLLEIVRKAGVERFVINGSFTTDVPEPNDVDCVLLMSADFPRDPDAEQELLSGLPFLEIQLVRAARFRMLVEAFFATDRHSVPKGDDRGVAMNLQDEHELATTRQKLRLLEESYSAAQQDQSGNPHVRELELRSLKQLINQLREEISRFESRRVVASQ